MTDLLERALVFNLADLIQHSRWHLHQTGFVEVQQTLAFTFTLQGEEIAAVLTSSGLGIYGMPADTVIVDGPRITIRIPRLDLEFTGVARMTKSGAVMRIDGDWFQYSEMVPVILLPVENPSF